MIPVTVQLFWAAAKERWPDLTEAEFRAAAQAVLDRVPPDGQLSVNEMSIQLEQELLKRKQDAES